jgi:hypothetical protein
MSEMTLEALAKRVESLERKLAELSQPKKDWRSVVGMFEDSEFIRQVDAEVEAAREADRKAGREGREG